MAASVLNSERADDMSIFVVRAFVRMREALAANQQIMAKLTELEHRVESHDGNIQELIEAIRELMEPSPSTNRRIGFSLSPVQQRTPPASADCFQVSIAT
jgi:hypothetical protein